MNDHGNERSDAVMRALHPIHEIIRQGQNLADYHAIYQKFVMDHELMARQKSSEGRGSLRMLRRLITNSIVVELVSFWECDRRSPAQSLSLPGALHRLKIEFEAHPGLLAFPLPNGRRGFADASERLSEMITTAENSPRFVRLKNHRDKYIAHRLSITFRERTGELPIPKYEDVDRCFHFTLAALRELSKSIYPMCRSPAEIADSAERSVISMTKAWNRRLGNLMPPPDGN